MQRLGEIFARLTQRWLPDAMALACLLTLLVMGVAVAVPQAANLREMGIGSRAVAVARIWLDAVWNPGFLTFALQMCVVLLTGFGLARAPLALRGLRWLARLARTNRGAVFLIALVSCAGCWINWGFGLIFAGVLAGEVRRELSRRGVACEYALIVAAAYAGMMVWHGGFSGSAPLKVASDGIVIETNGVTETIEPIAIRATILSPANIGLTVVLMLAVPTLLCAMGRKRVGSSQVRQVRSDEIGVSTSSPPENTDAPLRTPADRINESWLLPVVIACVVFVALVRALADRGAGAIGLNFVNSAFLAFGLVLHGSLRSYLAAVLEGGQAIVGIVIQFPLYSGIQGVMFSAGLAAAISQGFVDGAETVAGLLHVSAQQTFPVATLLSAGLVNFFVPSGGGQWIVQGPIMCSAAKTLNVPIEQTVMAVAYGDQLTNMVQPFWAIPLMGMTKVNAREFLGYCALLMLIATPVFAVALLLF